MKTVTISSKGQITLPKELRERYHLLEGEEALIMPTAEGILIKHRRVNLRGILSGKLDVEAFAKDLHDLRREWTL